MLEISYTWLETVIDVSTKSLLVAFVAGLTLAVLRVRDTNVRHRVWTAVLAGMLAMPLLVLVTPSVPLPGWMAVRLQPPPVESVAQLPAPVPPVESAPAEVAASGDLAVRTDFVEMDAGPSAAPLPVDLLQPFESTFNDAPTSAPAAAPEAEPTPPSRKSLKNRLPRRQSPKKRGWRRIGRSSLRQRA